MKSTTSRALALAATAVALWPAGGTAAAACPVRSGYDITVTHEALIFERESGPPRRIEMSNGVLSDEGHRVRLAPADRDRMVRFEKTARALVPRVRDIGKKAVDLVVVAVREEAAATSPNSAASPSLNARLDSRAAELKARIAKSNTSKEWRGHAFNRYAAEALSDIVPLVGGDLAQQALDATLRGEFGRAGQLSQRAAGVRGSLERRIQHKLVALQPDMDRLCPAIRTLDALEAALAAHLRDGSRLNLLDVGS